MSDLKKQGTWTPGSWALSRTPSLPSTTQSAGAHALLCTCRWPLELDGEEPWLRAGRGVPSRTRCQWSEAALKAPQRSLLPPSVSLQEGSLGRGAGAPGEPGLQMFSQGLIHPFPTCSCELADDSALKTRRYHRGLSSSLLLQAPACELPAARTSRQHRTYKRAPCFPQPAPSGLPFPDPRHFALHSHFPGRAAPRSFLH